MDAAGIAGGLQLQLARRVAAEHIALQYAAAAPDRDRAWPRPRHRRAARESLRKMRPLEQSQERRKDRLPARIEQERGAPILARAANRAHEMTEQSARQLRCEQHRRAPRRQAAVHRAARSARSAARRPIDCGDSSACGIARDRVPVVALHVVALLRDQRAAERVAGARQPGQKAMAVAVDAHAAVRVDAWRPRSCSAAHRTRGPPPRTRAPARPPAPARCPRDDTDPGPGSRARALADRPAPRTHRPRCGARSRRP